MTRFARSSPCASERRAERRAGVALALVLAALILAGALAAGAVMAADHGMRDAAGALARARALAAMDKGLDFTAAPSSWDPAWTAFGAPGVIATIATAPPDAVDTTRVIRLSTGLFLLISEARSANANALAARARASRVIVLDSAGRPTRPAAHGWVEMP